MEFLRKFLQCFFVWNVPGHSNMSIGDVIIAHAGGESLDGGPGEINRYLAGVIRDILKEKPGIAVIAQGELAPCLEELWLVGNIPCQKDVNYYIDSIFVTKIFKVTCQKNGWKHPILVTYQPHMWRALKVCEKMGMDVVVASTTSIYDKECSQRWMTTPWFNTPRELIVRLIWLFQGKI